MLLAGVIIVCGQLRAAGADHGQLPRDAEASAAGLDGMAGNPVLLTLAPAQRRQAGGPDGIESMILDGARLFLRRAAVR